MIKQIIIISFILLFSKKFSQTVIINEFLASNVTNYPEMVDFDDYSDWLELYNWDTTAKTLNGYFITDDISIPLKWKIPDSTIIDGEGYIIIWADDYDEIPGEAYIRPYWPWDEFTTKNYHTNFKLNKSGDQIALFKANQWESSTLIEAGALWKYLDDGSDQELGWITIDFDDSGWGNGNAELGYGDGDETTVVSYGLDEDQKYITTYFRKEFFVDIVDDFHNLNLRLLRDDGAIVYLNGNEVVRDNMPSGIINYDTPATDAVAFGEEDIFFDWSISGDLLQNGQNIIAVEIHQVDESSSDISFNLELNIVYYSDITLIDSVSYENQLTDVSYGRNSEFDSWSLYGEPTPGFPNSTNSTNNTESCGEVEVSIESGFYSGAIDVLLSTGSNNEQIYYTLDGSKPGSESLQYSGPLSIESTIVLRARALENDKLPGKISSFTYFIYEESYIPTISLIAEPKTLWDQEIGIYENEYKQREIPVTLQYFDEENILGFEVNIGARLGGENIWTKPQKPLTIYTRNRFGEDFINYQLFENKNITRFSRIVLRNGGDDWEETLIRDPMTESLVYKMMNCGYMSYKPSSIFINGSYWGIYNIREKFDTNFFFENFNADPNNIDHLEYTNSQNGTELQVVEGTINNYDAMINYIMNNDLNNPSVYAQVRELMNVDSFIDHLLMTIYSGNTSWGHNREWWRPRNESGKWQWLIVDLDRGFNSSNISINLLDDLMVEYELFNYLLNNESFKDRFIQRAAAHLNNTFQSERIDAIVDSLSENIAAEMPRHISKWGSQGGISSMNEWEDELIEIKQFAEDRCNIVRTQIMEQFSIDETVHVLVNVEPPGSGNILINSVPVLNNGEEQNHFKNISMSISATAKPGYQFIGWDGLSEEHDFIYNCNMDSSFTAVFQISEEIILPNIISENTVLTNNQSYVVLQNLVVNPGVSLTIGTGVQISMPENSNIIIEGQLIINGTPQDPVQIIPHSSGGGNRWGALCFNSATDSSYISHLKLEGASVGIEPLIHRGSISSYNSHIKLSHIEIEDVIFPIYIEGGSISIDSSYISCDYICDFINVKGGNALIENCIFFGSNAPDTDAIDLDNVVNGVIRGNRIYDFQGLNSDGIDIGENSQGINILSNLIYHSYDKGISIGQQSSVNIIKNLVIGGNHGVAVKDSSFAYILNNTFFNNDTSISCFEKNEGAGGGSAEIINTILSNSMVSPIFTDELSNVVVSFSLSNTEDIEGESNLFADPMFIDPGMYNLEIANNSPCIDAGDPNIEFDSDGSNSDIGSYYIYNVDDYIFSETDSLIYELKINELLAKNDSFNADEVGEFDDWVEIFNPTNQPLSLSGLFLTDDLTELTKWQFPDSLGVLMPGAYLLLWCDDNELQGINHTNFRLNADGEILVLTQNNGLTIIDSISFGAQTSNQSFGRIPDGHEDWSILFPTPEGSNAQLGNFENDVLPSKYYIHQNFPNPFNSNTIIRYGISEDAYVILTIYDLMGREILQLVNNSQSIGNKSVKWNGLNKNGEPLSAGVYIYKIQAGNFIDTKKMILLK